MSSGKSVAFWSQRPRGQSPYIQYPPDGSRTGIALRQYDPAIDHAAPRFSIYLRAGAQADRSWPDRSGATIAGSWKVALYCGRERQRRMDLFPLRQRTF